MDFVNSRQLTSQDGFLQLFAKADEYVYVVTSAPEGAKTEREVEYRLTVKQSKAKKGEGSQHDVKVYWDVAHRRYTAKPEALEISANDYVMWHCDRAVGAPPYSVRGRGKAGSFSNSALGPHAVFTHFFLTPGDVSYSVNDRGKYLIRVIDHRKIENAEYAKRSADAPLVTIKGGAPVPAQLEIVAGQTVVWLVDGESGISIASVRS